MLPWLPQPIAVNGVSLISPFEHLIDLFAGAASLFLITGQRGGILTTHLA
jgi:hypothetical protein